MLTVVSYLCVFLLLEVLHMESLQARIPFPREKYTYHCKSFFHIIVFKEGEGFPVSSPSRRQKQRYVIYIFRETESSAIIKA